MVDIGRERHALLREPQQLLLPLQLETLALSQLLVPEEPLLLLDDQAQLLNLLLLALGQVLLARAFTQRRHRRETRGLVVGQLALLCSCIFGSLLALVRALVGVRGLHKTA